MALETEQEKAICAKYGARDKEGFVHCHECPLHVLSFHTDCACKATCHYDPESDEWVPD